MNVTDLRRERIPVLWSTVRETDRQTDRQTEQRFRTGTKTPISTQLIKDPHLNPANH